MKIGPLGDKLHETLNPISCVLKKKKRERERLQNVIYKLFLPNQLSVKTW